MKLIRRHWRGDLPLHISVVYVFIGLSLAYHLLHQPLIAQFYNQPSNYLVLTVCYSLVTTFIFFPWQLRGVLRAVERHFLQHENHLVLYTVQAIAIGGLILTISILIGNFQSLVYYWEKKTFEQSNKIVEYSLSVSPDGKRLMLQGVLEFGLTKATKKLLTENSAIETVVLDSIGGQIYEGRGLAKLFKQHGLTTYVVRECSSSCSTAFIGGKKRYLGTKARLGFHQYAVERSPSQHNSIVYDLQEEQEKDTAFFRSQGIKQPFLEIVFQAPQDSMWFPEPAVLLEHGVIDALMD